MPGPGLHGVRMQLVRLKRRKLITLVLTLGLAFAIGFVAVQSHAQTWPQRTVRVILPLPAGTATDMAARLFAQRLAERWGQPVIVDLWPNRHGTSAGRTEAPVEPRTPL